MAALRYCRLEIVEYCLRNGCPTGDNDVCYYTMLDPDHSRALRTLKLLRKFSVPWGEETCIQAARTGELEALKWAVSHGCLWNPEECANLAAEYGRLDILKWIKLQGCHFDGKTSAAAASKGHLEVLQWLHSEKCSWNKKTCLNAIRYGYVDIIQYCIDQKFPFDEEVYESIMQNSVDPILILKSLVRSGYVLNEDVLCCRAAMREDFKLLRWLRFNDCPWDENVCNWAVQNNDFAMLKYAHENGCPWTKETYAYSVSYGLEETVYKIPTYEDARSEEIFDYLEEYDCPIPESSEWCLPLF